MLAPIVVVLLAVGTGAVIWKRNGDKNRLRERGWALFILLIGTLLITAQLLRLPVPNPADWISLIFAPVYKPILSWVEEDIKRR